VASRTSQNPEKEKDIVLQGGRGSDEGHFFF